MVKRREGEKEEKKSVTKVTLLERKLHREKESSKICGERQN